MEKADANLYDLRRFLKPVDTITFDSYMACKNAAELARAPFAAVIATARVVRVYKYFCFAQLKTVQECVNRWDIYKINGHRVDFGRF